MNVTNPPEVANCPMYPFRYNRSRHSTSNVTCSLSSSGMLGITEILRNQENLSLVGLRSKTSLDDIGAFLQSQITGASEGAYNNLSNNSNGWLQGRIFSLGLGVV